MADTVATIRPDGVVSNTWTLAGGAPDAASALNDNSDLTFLSSVSGGDAVLTLGTVSIPALAQIRSVTPRIRSRPGGSIVSGGPFRVVLSGTPGNSNTYTPPDNINIYNYTGTALTTRPTDGAAWTQADIDALQFEVSGAAGTNYYEAYVDVAYNQAPVAVTLGPARTVTDGVTNATTTITSATASFQVTDVGRTISGGTIPAGATIVSRTNSTTVVISAAASGSASGVTLVIGASISTTNQAGVVWSYNDPEVDSQERFRVKIFTTAQAAIGGFNPDTSPNTADSGETFSSATSWLSPALTAGLTYVPYVKVADAGSGGRYGAWSAGTPFTIVAGSGLLFDVPATPSVTSATPDSANNRVAVVVQGIDNELTRNQSSFESSILGWESSLNLSALARDTAQFLHGQASMKMTSTAAGDMAARTLTAAAGTATTGFQNALVKVLVGATYTALASFRAAASARSCRIDIRWYNSSGTLLSTSNGTSAADTTTGWTQVSCTATAPANAVYAGLLVTVLATGAASEVHWVDQVDIGPGSSLVWTRGGFVGNQGQLLDTFSRADNASSQGVSEGPLNTGWTPAVGTWGIQSGRSYLASATTNAVSFLPSPVIADGVLTCDVTLSPTLNRANCGVVLKASFGTTFLLVQLVVVSGTNAVQLQKNNAGTYTVLATSSSVALVNGNTYGVKVEFFGGLYRVWIDKKDGAGYTKVIDYQMAAGDVALYAAAVNNGYGLFVNNGAANDDGGSRFDNIAVNNANTQLAVVQRSVDGGTTWSTVRTANRVDLTDPGQVGSFFDYEAPRNVAVQYRVAVQATESTVTVVSAESTPLAMSPNLLSDGNAWLKSPVDSTKNIPVNLVKDSANSVSTEDQVVFAPLGRADYLIHGGTVRLDVFDGLQFLFLNDAAYQAFETLRKEQSPLLLQTCYGDQSTGAPEEFWVRLGPARTVTRTTMSTSPGQIRTVKIPAHQVLAPVVT